MKSGKSLQTRFNALSDNISRSDDESAIVVLRTALKDKSNLYVAKAAQHTADRLLYPLIDDLCNAFERFMERSGDTDKTCAAKRAIARALYTLDYDNSAFYQQGIRTVQMEPAYGGAVDTAIELRCTSALGLMACNDSRVLLDVLELLHDKEYSARIGAISAIKLAQPFHAELLLRNKIVQGDDEPEVIAQAFSALMQVAPEDSLEFVERYLDFVTPGFVNEAAAMALGECRLDDAMEILTRCSENLSINTPFQAVLFRAIALQRNQKAYDYLLNIIRTQDYRPACFAIEALSIYSYNEELTLSVNSIITERKLEPMKKCFNKYWRKE